MVGGPWTIPPTQPKWPFDQQNTGNPDMGMNGTKKANATIPTIATQRAMFLRLTPQRMALWGVKFYS